MTEATKPEETLPKTEEEVLVNRTLKDEPYRTYEPKSDAELKKIAKDLYAGQIFCDRQIDNPHDLKMVFMVLALSPQSFIDDMQRWKINFLYEYMSEAGPRSCNGMPCFFSVQMLNDTDTEKMFGYYKAVKEAMDTI